MTYIVNQLEANLDTFRSLLDVSDSNLILWKPQPDKWCLLEMVCHLLDEEREDFRARTRWSLEHPETMPPGIDPVGWVTQRAYMEQDYDEVVRTLLNERKESVKWLRSLDNPDWSLGFDHTTLGRLTAGLFLSNWLAHDYLHFRQINNLKYAYLKTQSDEDLTYAGNW